MTADLDVIIVHYHAAAQVRDAVSALRRDAESTGLSLQIIMADNGNTSEERTLLQSLPIRRACPGTRRPSARSSR
jgi:hypothetical protein